MGKSNRYSKKHGLYKKLHVFFIDLKKKNNCIHRESMIKILREFQFPNKLIIITISVIEATVKVKIERL